MIPINGKNMKVILRDICKFLTQIKNTSSMLQIYYHMKTKSTPFRRYSKKIIELYHIPYELVKV